MILNPFFDSRMVVSVKECHCCRLEGAVEVGGYDFSLTIVIGEDDGEAAVVPVGVGRYGHDLSSVSEFLLFHGLSDEWKVCVIKDTGLHYGLSGIMGGLVSKIHPIVVFCHLLDDGDYGTKEFLLESPVEGPHRFGKDLWFPAHAVEGIFQVSCSLEFP